MIFYVKLWFSLPITNQINSLKNQTFQNLIASILETVLFKDQFLNHKI